MQVRTSLPVDSNESYVLALGNFDGVHLGHRRLLEDGLEQAERLNVKLCVLIFEPHPLKVLFPDREIKLLTSTNERLQSLEKIGVDCVYLLTFTKEMADTSPEQFVENVLLPIGAIHVVVGFNYSFGAKGKGDPQLICSLGQKHGFGVSVIQAQTIDGLVISSSSIRKALLQGDISLAKVLLGHPPSLNGIVSHGEQRGRQLGFPTANLMPSDDILVPKRGVYAVWAILDGKRIFGMMNIGKKPTFHTVSDTLIEVHFFDFAADLYGREILVHIEDWLRDERKFDGVNELLFQLNEDRVKAQSLLKKVVQTGDTLQT